MWLLKRVVLRRKRIGLYSLSDTIRVINGRLEVRQAQCLLLEAVGRMGATWAP